MSMTSSRINIKQLCGLFGHNRQSYYQHRYRRRKKAIEHTEVLSMVVQVRKDHPRIGTKKIHYMIRPKLEELGIKLGRDKLYNILRDHHMLLRKRKRKVRTTFSGHGMRRYPNLLKDCQLNRVNQVLVSDISYLRMRAGGHVYWVHIMDAYSKKILAHKVSKDLGAKHALECLKQVIDQLKEKSAGVIHHTDAGSQYCSTQYVNTLKKHNILISMNESGDPRENAVAERLIGIIKSEYIVDEFENYDQACQRIKRIVQLYNQSRPHLSCGMLTPEQAEHHQEPLKKMWKSKKDWTSFLQSSNLTSISKRVKNEMNGSKLKTKAQPSLTNLSIEFLDDYAKIN